VISNGVRSMPVRIYKNGWFHRFCRKEKISDASLRDAVARADRGLIDAALGGGLIKQRVARPGAGRSGGFRTLIFFRAGTRAVFAFGFGKSERDNIDVEDEADLKKSGEDHTRVHAGRDGPLGHGGNSDGGCK
jgi:hypothetical protein